MVARNPLGRSLFLIIFPASMGNSFSLILTRITLLRLDRLDSSLLVLIMKNLLQAVVHFRLMKTLLMTSFQISIQHIFNVNLNAATIIWNPDTITSWRYCTQISNLMFLLGLHFSPAIHNIPSSWMFPAIKLSTHGLNFQFLICSYTVEICRTG